MVHDKHSTPLEYAPNVTSTPLHGVCTKLETWLDMQPWNKVPTQYASSLAVSYLCFFTKGFIILKVVLPPPSWRRPILKYWVYLTHLAVYSLSVYHECGLPAATMDMPATSRKHPASSPHTTEALQPTASVGSISPPHIHTLGNASCFMLHLLHTFNLFFITTLRLLTQTASPVTRPLFVAY